MKYKLFNLCSNGILKYFAEVNEPEVEEVLILVLMEY